MPSLDPALVARLEALAAATPSLSLLVLFGSRARDEARPTSDWDFGFLASAPFDVDELTAQLSSAVGSDRVDVVDLDRAGGLLRYRAARDGLTLFERHRGAFQTFAVAAVQFWCDMEPVLRRAYDQLLDALPAGPR